MVPLQPSVVIENGPVGAVIVMFCSGKLPVLVMVVVSEEFAVLNYITPAFTINSLTVPLRSVT